ncbi:MAG: metallophosphatase family protein [Spirochaetia bacterium]|nr:metallophosphatase family protein [Spirochaetia bacterium]
MRYAIISDIHSNLEAMTAVMDFLKVNPVDGIISCGDLIGYGPNPKECIELAKATPNMRSVVGNHDAASCGRISADGFNDTARTALEVNQNLAGAQNLEYFKNLADFISENDLLFVHGSPRDRINEYLFMMHKFKENIDFFKERICFVGHTHHALLYQYEFGSGNDSCINIEENVEVFTLSPMKKYIINVGSVGQPRDGKPGSMVVFYDTKSMTLTFRRISYNYQATQTKMRALHLPEELIQRLATGY